MNILLLGDIVGPSGRKAVIEKLPNLKKKKKIDFVIVNGENAADQGVGITKKITEELLESGVDVITTGKSALECSELIEASMSKLVGYACIIDRSNSKSLIKDKIVSQIKLKIDTYKNKELPDDLKKIQPTKPGSRNL